MIVKIIGIVYNEDDLNKRFSDIILGNGEKITDINDDIENGYPIIIYEVDGKKWIAEEGDYLWGLMTNEEIYDVDNE